MGTESEHTEPDCRRQFQAAVSVIQNLPKNGAYRPSYEEMLRFYSYYKQATMGPCRVPRPGFWDPIGRYKWDAWNSLGRMSKDEAMAAYISQMKRVAQKVIDTVPLGEEAEEMFGYFEPLYQVIPDMPRPPESFLRRVTGRTGQLVDDGALGAAPQPRCPPEELAPPSPEACTPKDLDAEDFCDSVEQLEPELQAEQRGAPGGALSARTSPSPVPTDRVTAPGGGAGIRLDCGDGSNAKLDPRPRWHPLPGIQPSPCGAPFLPVCSTEGSEGGLPGPRESDVWLVRTVRALQENMRDVQGRLQSLEDMPHPHKQQKSSARPWPLRLSGPTLFFFLLWPFIVQWLLRQLRTHKR